ncbi:hypothetical protein APD45_15215 [Acinetobacter baumannii]|nr:hypothetical protein APD45_15320 [Acinetobacter baumannii]KQE42547.1 hypothetical protein APD45_15215 [Acinetobacter baumannii]MBC6790835.1 hypothetical protein [Acinetobacter baumannii]OFD30898.1 hypothetical protein A1D08_01615 [Acinetobacter baumannii]POZ10103.1 hypothetical protein C3415_05625 [Acinetobacter baumannii]
MSGFFILCFSPFAQDIQGGNLRARKTEQYNRGFFSTFYIFTYKKPSTAIEGFLFSITRESMKRDESIWNILNQ